MKKLRHIFFDLDHTLWDYETSSQQALTELYQRFDLSQLFVSADAFIKVFHHVNGELWDRYNKGEVDREHIRTERFARMVKGRIEENYEWTNKMSDFYISYCPTLPNLMPGTMEVLDRLQEQFEMSIISNGFTDTQSIKLQRSGIDHFFSHVITSESAKSRKPDTAIFDHALELSQTKKEEVIMVGDNLKTDIAGAVAAGWEAIWYQPEPDGKRHNKPHQPMIRDLREIVDLVAK